MEIPIPTLKRLYGEMLRIRMVEETIAELYPEHEMRCPVHLCTGQEAVAAGVCANLAPADVVLSGHRSHGHYLAKGGDLRRMMAELYGRTTGCSRGRGGSMHLIDVEAGFLGATPIVGSSIPIAAGVALGMLMLGRSLVTVVFFGEGAAEEGVLHETLNFAALRKLPIIFVCENNLYSVCSPLRVRQPDGRQIVSLAIGHGVESYRGDGNDVVEVFELARRAVSRVRQTSGPVFLEFSTYRWREHCGPNFDNDLGYRSPEEIELWRKRCPIERLRQHLIRDGLIGEAELNAVAGEVRREMDKCVAFARSSPFPEESRLVEGVYA